jgi:hypothetical protein
MVLAVIMPAALTGILNGDLGSHPAQMPTGATAAIIVSDDPFFQDSQNASSAANSLVSNMNTWVQAGTNRQVVYPSQVYTGLQGNRTIIGPDLLKAYMLLGALAGGLLANTNSTFGWVEVASDIIPPPSQAFRKVDMRTQVGP